MFVSVISHDKKVHLNLDKIIAIYAADDYVVMEGDRIIGLNKPNIDKLVKAIYGSSEK